MICRQKMKNLNPGPAPALQPVEIPVSVAVAAGGDSFFHPPCSVCHLEVSQPHFLNV